MIALSTPEDLLRVKLFGGVESVKPDALQDIFDCLVDGPRFDLQAGQALLSKGQINHRMFVLLRGSLQVHLDSPEDEPVATLGPGECVGEFSMVDKGPASAHVIAEVPSRVVAIDFSQLMQLVTISPAVTINLVYMLVQRLREGNRKLTRSRAQQHHFEEQIYFDGLTGVLNRYWLDNHLPELCEVCRTKSESLTLLMMDIDHFKRFNDTYGHLVGDLVLERVAGALKERLRDTDFVARYGGEEFIVLLPKSGPATAMAVAERLRIAVSKLELTQDDGKPLSTVTISIGVAHLREGENPKQLIQRADEALYRAKDAGRNRVTEAAKLTPGGAS